MPTVVISGPPPVQILDVTGPLEVFSNVPHYRLCVVAADGSGELETNRGVKISGAVSREDVAGSIDPLVIAGGPGAESGEYNREYVEWIADAASRSRRIASICTGAFLLAAAGLLEGKRAVPPWGFCGRVATQV